MQTDVIVLRRRHDTVVTPRVIAFLTAFSFAFGSLLILLSN
jgi:hypothetical protein